MSSFSTFAKHLVPDNFEGHFTAKRSSS